MMKTFQILLFAPGRDPAGVLAEACFQGGQFSVTSGDGLRLTAPVEALNIASSGFDGRQWQLAWATPHGRVAAVLAPGVDARAWLAQLPPPLANRLAGALAKRRRHRLRLYLGVGLGALLLLLPFMLLALFWSHGDRIAGWAAGRISLEQEAKLGEMAFAQMRPALNLLQAGPVPGVVAAIGHRLTAGSAYRYQWFVADSPQVNAFAMPGGYVVVYTGLLRAADSSEELAGVLAHEVQHVEMRHALKNMLHGMGWRALLAVALGDLSGGVWGGMAEQLGSLSYSRDLERQADLGGLAALRRAGIAPQGLASFFTKLAHSEGQGIELLSSHPASETRLQALRQAIAAQGSYAAQPLPYDWSALQGTLSGKAP